MEKCTEILEIFPNYFPVAQNVIRMESHHVQMQGVKVKVMAKPVSLKSGVRFQVTW